MTPREVATEFIQRFAAGDIEGLGAVLAEDLAFSGPLLEVDTRAAYLEALRSDPPEACDVRVVEVSEGTDDVTVVYEYLKPEGAVEVEQWFRVVGGRIVETRLKF